jgi:hypothetical protein
MKAGSVAVAVVALLLMSSMFLAPNANAQNPHAKWLFLLYLDADNSLDVYAGAHHISVVEDDFRELQSVGSTSSAVAYVLVDRVSGPANLFKVNKNSFDERKDFALDGKEANMGDPDTLRSFVTYAQAASPADHTLLIFWDHGSPRGVAWDDHADDAGATDFLSQWEVVGALSGLKVDVIGADECNVGHTEVAYEYAMGLNTEYLVAAETYTGWRGFPYDAILRELTKNPEMSARDVAKMMIEQTMLLLNQPPYSGESVNSHSAIDLSKMQELVSALGNLTDLLSSHMNTYANVVFKARGNAQNAYGANAINLIDLRTFVQSISSKTSSKEIRDACARVLAVFDKTVIAVHATNSLQGKIFGMGIALPNHSWEMPSYYGDFKFADEGWMDFLEAYWAVHGSV